MSGTVPTINGPFEALGQAYSHPMLRLMIQIVSAYTFGIAGGVDALVMSTITDVRQERLRVFLDAVAAGITELTEDDLRNEEWLYTFITTTKAVWNTRNREKIQLFGKLFSEFNKSRGFESADTTDVYEEWLAILNDLTYREFKLLLMIEQKFNRVTGGYTDATTDKWAEFDEAVEIELNIPRHEVNGFLTRLIRTGLYRPTSGFSVNPRGEVTPNFDSFIQALNYGSNFTTQAAVETE